MGRLKKPTRLKILQGTQRADRMNENEPIYSPIIPTIPEHLSEYAKEEWIYIIKFLDPVGLITEVDKAALAGYCQSYGRWRQAEEQLNKTELVIKTQSGNLIQNPFVGIANKAMEHMRKYITMFGLSPVDRAKVSAKEPKKTENKFARFK